MFSLLATQAAHLTLCGSVGDSRIDSSSTERMQGKNEASVSLNLGSRGGLNEMWFPVGTAIGEVQAVYPCWRKYITGGGL